MKIVNAGPRQLAALALALFLVFAVGVGGAAQADYFATNCAIDEQRAKIALSLGALVDWIKSKNPNTPAVRREPEEYFGVGDS